MGQFDQLWLSLADDLTDLLKCYRTRVVDLTVSTKPDNTLLTEADLEVERLITNHIRAFDRGAAIIGEEDGRTDERAEVEDEGKRIFVIDPIDGTAEFVRPDRREFCSVVCVLENYEPVSAFVLAPELGLGGGPISIVCDRLAATVKVNGVEISRRPSGQVQRWASVTRSGPIPRAFESHMAAAGYGLKTRTTSQTLDMIRTALDLAPYTEAGCSQFDIFFRADQKIWDGLAGICVGEAVGLRSSDRTGNRRVPVDSNLLRNAEPTFDFTVLGVPEAVEWFLEIV